MRDKMDLNGGMRIGLPRLRFTLRAQCEDPLAGPEGLHPSP